MKNYFLNHYSKIQGIDLDSEESFLRWYKSVLRAYDAELKPYSEYFYKKSVLEIGCGIGGLLNYLNYLNHKDYFGIDQSKEQIEICKKYVTNNVRQVEAFEFLSNNEVQYDFIIMFDLIEHIKKEKIKPLLKLIKNSLKPKGSILIRTPNMSSLYSNHSRYIDFTHEVGFTSESISQVLYETGFRIVKCSNNSIGRKRIIILKILNKLLSKIYSFKQPEIISVNLVVLAEK